MVNKTYKNKKHKTNKPNKTKKQILSSNKVIIKDRNCTGAFYKPFVKELHLSTLSNKVERKSHTELMKFFVKNLKLQYAPDKIRAQNDFYTYINYRWLTNVEIDSIKLSDDQKYLTQIDNFRLVQDKVYEQLNEIIVDNIKKNKNKNNKQINSLENFYKSTININSIESSTKYINEYIEQLDELRKDKQNIWKLLAIINKNAILKPRSPFYWNLAIDEKDPKNGIGYLYPIILPIIDINAYIDKNNNYRKEFTKGVKNIFTNCIDKKHNTNYKDVILVQDKLFMAFSCNEFKEDEHGYNLVTAKDALNIYNFNWAEFTKELGYQNTPEKFVCKNLNYLKCCSKLLIEEWDSEEWRNYWIWLFVNQIIRSTQEWFHYYYNYYSKFERGQSSPIKIGIVRTTLYINIAFNKWLTTQYVAKYNDNIKNQYVKGVSEDLKEIFIRIIKRNDWLSPKTKKHALKKLDQLIFEVSQPLYIEEDPVLDYAPNDLWGNFIKVFDWMLHKEIANDGKKFIQHATLDWTQSPPKFSGYQPYMVNAQYIPTQNKVYIPIGYIQEPFLNLSDEKGIEYNLANMGFTIAHELSHALDDLGGKFDETGKLYDWWGESDKKKFKKIQTEIIKQYEGWAKRDGLDFDAALSVGEDIADISGLAICEEYLRAYQIKNKDVLASRSSSYSSFYIFYALQQRQKVNKKALTGQLLINPHPLDKYRCNIPLSRSLIFKLNYNINKDDLMYWPNDNSVW